MDHPDGWDDAVEAWSWSDYGDAPWAAVPVATTPDASAWGRTLSHSALMVARMHETVGWRGQQTEIAAALSLLACVPLPDDDTYRYVSVLSTDIYDSVHRLG